MLTLNVSLSRSKSRALSAMTNNIAQVFFATSVGAILVPIDSTRLFVVISYLVLSALFWFLSIVFAEKGKL